MALFRASNDVLGFFHLVRCSVDDKHVFCRSSGDIVLQYAVLRDADANQPRPKSRLRPKNNCAFEGQLHPRYDWAAARIGPSPGMKNRPDPKSNPQNPPKTLLPRPNTSCDPAVVVADDVFLRVRIPSYNRQAFHIDACLLEFLDSVFCLFVSVIDCRYRVLRVHSIPFSMVDLI